MLLSHYYEVSQLRQEVTDQGNEAKLASLRAAIDEGDASPDVVGFDREGFLQELIDEWVSAGTRQA